MNAVLQPSGLTALMEAVKNGQLKMVELLCGSGALVNFADKQGLTAMHLAATHGFPDIIRAMASMPGTEISCVCHTNDTPLHLAVRNGKLDAVIALDELGAKLYVQNSSGTSPLDVALSSGKSGSEIVAYLEGACARRPVSGAMPSRVYASRSSCLALILEHIKLHCPYIYFFSGHANI